MGKFFIAFLLLLAFAVRVLQADSITLKDGKIITGEILSDTPDGVLIEYNVTPTIKDQKTFPHDYINNVVKEPIDDKDFRALGPLTSPHTLVDLSFHDDLILKKIPKFLNKYPYSSHLAELRATLGTLKDERARLLVGDRKIDGVWISTADISANPYQLGAKIKFTEIKEQAAEKNTLGALQSCELLEKNYPGSAILPDTIDLGLNQIIQLQSLLDKAKKDFDILNKRRLKALELAPGDQVLELKNAIETENQNTKNAIKNALTDGSKFFPIFPNNKEALDTLQALITSETTRWTVLSKTTMRDGIKASKNSSDAVTQGDLKTAQEQLALSEKLWPANIENDKLKQQVESLAKSQSAAATKK